MASQLIVVSKVKDAAGTRVSGEAIVAMSEEVEKLIKAAAKEAKADKMETIKARHVERAIAARSQSSNPPNED